MTLLKSAVAGVMILALGSSVASLADAVDEKKPEDVAKAFIAAFEKGDAAAAKKLASERILQKFKTDEEFAKFLRMWKDEGNFLEVGTSDKTSVRGGKTYLRLPIKYEKDGAKRESSINMVKENDVWRWDET